MELFLPSVFSNKTKTDFDDFFTVPSSLFLQNPRRHPLLMCNIQPYDYKRATRSCGSFVRKLQLDSAFLPEEVEVKLCGDKRKLKIEARSEKKCEKEGFRSYSINEISQTIDLPEDVDVGKLRTVLNENNQVVITAPKLAINEKPLEIKLNSIPSNENDTIDDMKVV